ncbi:MAG: HDIG domain-containing protein [Proteobacteria bacterium]|nr:HDIG domain-containing protein [Pseudomonadota bacterium]
MPHSSQPPAADGRSFSRALRTLPLRLMVRIDRALERPALRGLVLFALAAALALVIGGAVGRSRTVWRNLRVGARAQMNIKATRSFSYQVGEEELEQRRQQAAAKVLPVFDYHTDASAVVLARINQAFDSMTGAAAGHDDVAAEPRRGGAGDGPQDAPRFSRGRMTSQERERFARVVQADVAPRVFDRLVEARFAAEVRALVIMLLGSALDNLVISHQAALEPYLGGSLTLRPLVSGRPSNRPEQRLNQLDRIRDLEQIREQVRHLAKIHGTSFAPPLRRAVVELVESTLVPNVSLNVGETRHREEDARRRVARQPIPIVEGQVLVPDGDAITAQHLRVLRAMAGDEGSGATAVVVGSGLLLLVLLVTLVSLAERQFQRFIRHPRDLLAMGLLLVLFLVLARLGLLLHGPIAPGFAPIEAFLVPLAAGAVLVRLLITAEAAAIFAVTAALLAGQIFERNLALTIFYLVTGISAASSVRIIHSRLTVFKAGLLAGLFGAFTVLCQRLLGLGGVAAEQVDSAMLAAAGGGVLSALLVLALLPVLEWAFAYTTEITLLELANPNHPLLRELMLRAPGTYHHSMVVGSLAEAACDAIGANGLLARVAANYHDVGKLKNAPYFAENMRAADNPHHRLKPSMSGLIVRNHVRDGIEMMSQHGLPQLVIDTASQHHGRAMISFFYHKAIEQQDADDEVVEEDYRYPGPRPQSREAGVLMLADGVEAAARSLSEPTADRVQALVQRMINKQFTDGQLDHCDVTLRDLHSIARSFMQVLGGIYHVRPTYPWQRNEEAKRAEELRGGKEARRRDAPPPPPAAAQRSATGSLRSSERAGQGAGEDAERAAVVVMTPGGAGGEGASAVLVEGGGAEDGATGRQGKSGDGAPQGEGTGAAAAGPGGAGAIEAPDRPDIKRLGLN